MFDIGSCVVYRAEGVCRIVDIRTENFGTVNGAEQYYILSPQNDPKSTLFVPIENEKLTALMRCLLSAEQINELCRTLREERIQWIPESRARNNLFRELLAEGDRSKLIPMILTVTEQIEEQTKAGKKPTATDQNALRRAKKLLFDEFCTTTDLASEQDVLSLLRGELILCAKE